MTNPSVSWSADFRLSITRALADQLAATLAPLTPAPLTAANLARVEPRPGVYVLFVYGERVYVGKAASSLADRLGQHLRKLSGRTGIELSSVTFACVYVDEDLDAAAPEKLLIKRYRKHGSIPWNTNGFGNKDPGRNRDTSIVKEVHFDATYPINLDHVVTLASGTRFLGQVLDSVKTDLPYLLRYDNSKLAKVSFNKTTVTLPAYPVTVRRLAHSIINTLPSGWQLTALPGYLILYFESRPYSSALMWWRREEDQEAIETPGPHRFAPGPVETQVDDGELPTERPEGSLF